MRIVALTSALLLGTAAASAAPVPKNDTAPARALPAADTTPPRIVVLRPNEGGKITVTVMKTEKRKVQAMIAVAPGGPGGAAPPQPIVQEITVRIPGEVELAEVEGLKVYDTAGKEVPKSDALKGLAKGGVVAVSGDGKPVDPAFLATFREGTLVLVAPDLVVDVRPIKGGPPVMIGGGANGFPGVAPALPAPVPAPAPPRK